MDQLNEMYAHEYIEPHARKNDEDHHQLMDALDELMDINGDLDELAQSVAIASIATAIRRFQTNDNWPNVIYMYFSETFRSFTQQVREQVLLLTVPHIVNSSGDPQLVWYIDTAIEYEMYALLHLSFVESALVAEDKTMRAMGAYALIELPMSYWMSAGQRDRRSFLIERTLNDPVKLVRREIEESLKYKR